MNYGKQFIADRDRWQKAIEDVVCEMAMYRNESGLAMQVDISPLVDGFNKVWTDIIARQLEKRSVLRAPMGGFPE